MRRNRGGGADERMVLAVMVKDGMFQGYGLRSRFGKSSFVFTSLIKSQRFL